MAAAWTAAEPRSGMHPKTAPKPSGIAEGHTQRIQGQGQGQANAEAGSRVDFDF